MATPPEAEQYTFNSLKEFAEIFDRSSQDPALTLEEGGIIENKWRSWDSICLRFKYAKIKVVVTVLPSTEVRQGMLLDVPPRYGWNIQHIGAWLWVGRTFHNEEEFGGALLVSVGEFAVTSLWYILGQVVDDCSVKLPAHFMTLYEQSFLPKKNTFVDSKPVFYRCNDVELDALLSSDKVAQQTKILSTLATLFEFVLPEFTTQFEMLPYAEAASRHSLPVDGTTRPDKAAATPGYYARTSIAALISGYSKNTQICTQQLHNGYKTCSANAGFDAMNPMAFKQLFASMGMSPGNVSGVTTKALGFVVARNEELKFSLETTRNEMITLNTLRKDHRMTPWAVALFDSMRLLYEDAHLSTLGFAIVARAAVRNKNIPLRADMAQEADNLDYAAQLIQNRPFRGMSYTLDLSLQVARYPMFAYLGLLHHEKTFKGQKNAGWGAYVNGVKSH